MYLLSGQITIIPTPALKAFWGDSLTNPPFGVTSAEVVIIGPALCIYLLSQGVYFNNSAPKFSCFGHVGVGFSLTINLYFFSLSNGP